MQKGVHYDKTYAATPNQHSARILQAIMVRYGMKRLAFDITMAYCNAKLPPDQAVAVRYPNGFRRYKKVNGMSVELYMALMLNLYGHPAAGRNWDKTRNAGIKQDFSKQPWTVLRCIKEPCLFYFELTRPNTVERVYALIHTKRCRHDRRQ